MSNKTSVVTGGNLYQRISIYISKNELTIEQVKNLAASMHTTVSGLIVRLIQEKLAESK